MTGIGAVVWLAIHNVLGVLACSTAVAGMQDAAAPEIAHIADYRGAAITLRLPVLVRDDTQDATGQHRDPDAQRALDLSAQIREAEARCRHASEAIREGILRYWIDKLGVEADPQAVEKESAAFLDRISLDRRVREVTQQAGADVAAQFARAAKTDARERAEKKAMLCALESALVREGIIREDEGWRTLVARELRHVTILRSDVLKPVLLGYPPPSRVEEVPRELVPHPEVEDLPTSPPGMDLPTSPQRAARERSPNSRDDEADTTDMERPGLSPDARGDSDAPSEPTEVPAALVGAVCLVAGGIAGFAVGRRRSSRG
jgi:hypothetical protein